MGNRRVDKLDLDAINLPLDEIWERVEQVAQAAVAFTLPAGAKMTLSREDGQLKVTYSDGTIETWSKD